jgi:acetyltransferase-like isoleucine patch superfamily enzyme
VAELARYGEGCVIEAGVLVFHAEAVELGDRVYVGHRTMLKGYHKNRLVIGDGTWIGQDCFLHAAGGIEIGRDVGVGPSVKMITSTHAEEGRGLPILHSTLELAPIRVGDGADIGIGAIILPGVTIGQGAQIGAGAVVTADVPDFAVAAGVPARVQRSRP